MIWKESYNLKHKNGIENYINIQNNLNKVLKALGGKFERNKPKFQDGRIKDDFCCSLKTVHVFQIFRT